LVAQCFFGVLAGSSGLDDADAGAPGLPSAVCCDGPAPAESGVESRFSKSKLAIFCGLPSSRNVKSSPLRSVTGLPDLSRATTLTRTNWLSTLNLYSPWPGVCEAGVAGSCCCAGSEPIDKTANSTASGRLQDCVAQALLPVPKRPP